MDWISGAGESVRALFERFHVKCGDPSRPNRFRSEVLIAALSRRIFTAGVAGEFSHNVRADEVGRLCGGDWGEGRVLFFEIDERHLAR